MRIGSLCLSVLVLVFANVANIAAAPLIYATKGTENTQTYQFVAEYTGTLKIYFAGAYGKYDNEIGLLINGVDTGIYGLPSHESEIGDELDFGTVEEGDVFTFIMRNTSLGNIIAYSDPLLNKSYDSYESPHASVQHVYSSNYVADSSYSVVIPSGTFVGFEDKPASSTRIDWDYNDIQFVFVNEAPPPGPPVPEPTSLMGLVLVPMLLSRRFR